MTGWIKWSTGNCANTSTVTVLTNGIYANQSLCRKIRLKKILWDFEMQMDHVIPVWRPSLNIRNKKKTCQLLDNQQIIKQIEIIIKHLKIQSFLFFLNKIFIESWKYSMLESLLKEEIKCVSLRYDYRFIKISITFFKNILQTLINVWQYSFKKMFAKYFIVYKSEQHLNSWLKNKLRRYIY